MSSRHHVNHSINIGESGQRRYYNSCRAANVDIKKTSKESDINHVDFLVNGETVDVKGMKKTHHKAQILVELKNVRGDSGWCNPKGPKWIAFDFGLFFIHVLNSDLFSLVKNKCNLKTKAKTYHEALYKGYSRKDRDDLMTVVSLSDVIKECEHWFLPFSDFHEPYELL
jgi:hypothetical protein